MVAANPASISEPVPVSDLCVLCVSVFSSPNLSPFNFKLLALFTLSLEGSVVEGSTFNSVSLSPFAATLASSLQITEKSATLSPAIATLTSHVKRKSCVCHSYKKHPGWGVPFSPNLRTIKRGEAAPIFLATRHSSLATSSVPLNLLKSTRIQPSATTASKELNPNLNPLDATLTKKQGRVPSQGAGSPLVYPPRRVTRG